MRAVKLLLGLVFFAATPTYSKAEVFNRTLVHDDLTREYTLYIPSSYTADTAMPLVVNMHGLSSFGTQQMGISGMNLVAEENGFIVAYPDAVDRDWRVSDDHNIDFIDELLNTIESNYEIDSSRIYATGLSQGGVQSQIMAVARPNRFAAIASVSGTRALVGEPIPAFVGQVPNRPMPLMHIHGTADTLALYGGGEVNILGTDFTFGSVDSFLSDWVTNNGCGPDATTTEVPNRNTADNSTATLLTFGGCDTYTSVEGEVIEANVVHYRVNDGGHSWPVDANLRPPFSEDIAWYFPVNSDFNASTEIWRFFEQHQAAAVPEPPNSVPALGGDFEELATFEANPGWAEGPAFDGAGGIWFSDLGAPITLTKSSIYRYDLATGELELKLEDAGGANGLLFDAEGNLLTAHGDDRQITKRSTDDLNTVTIVADNFEGKSFSAPNDLIFDSKGGLYFTDPSFQPENNSVFYLSADQELKQVSTGLFYNNGLALSPDGDTLYVAETGSGSITAFDVNDDGSLSVQRTFASLPFTNGRGFSPDGMTIDPFGNLYVADIALGADPSTYDPGDEGPKIRVWNPAGEEILTFDVPGKAAANLLFGPAEDGKLYITATDSLWRVPIQFGAICEPLNDLLGDFDGDGSVQFSDFLMLSANFGGSGSYSEGDVDCDGEVAFADFLILSENFGKSLAPVANVPEPATFWIVFSSIPMMMRRRVR